MGVGQGWGQRGGARATPPKAPAHGRGVTCREPPIGWGGGTSPSAEGKEDHHILSRTRSLTCGVNLVSGKRNAGKSTKALICHTCPFLGWRLPRHHRLQDAPSEPLAGKNSRKPNHHAPGLRRAARNPASSRASYGPRPGGSAEQKTPREHRDQEAGPLRWKRTCWLSGFQN